MDGLELFIGQVEVFILFFFIALLYGSVGFGGGSSYLSMLALFQFEYRLMRAIALLCNLTVVSGGTYLFWKKGFLNCKKVWPFAIVSVPFAYLGGYLPISEGVFSVVLGCSLVIAAIIMVLPNFYKAKKQHTSSKSFSVIKTGIIGGGIGFLSGLVGIGGGIFLAPVLHLTKWGDAKTIAATSSFFILVNSISGLFGQFMQGDWLMDWSKAFTLIICVFFGGQIGSRWCAGILPATWIKNITAVLVFVVGIRLVIIYI